MNTSLDILQYIYNFKQEENRQELLSKTKAENRKLALEALSEKQKQKVKDMTEDQLQAYLNSLEA